jgi:hypothetical protein
MSEYKSLERKIWNSKPVEIVRDSVNAFVTRGIVCAYGAVVTPLRIPTFVRKIAKNQTVINNPPWGSAVGSPLEEFGAVAGAIGGLSVGLYGVTQGIGQPVAHLIDYENPLPAIVAGSVVAATNLASGVYEAVRSRKGGSS